MCNCAQLHCVYQPFNAKRILASSHFLCLYRRERRGESRTFKFIIINGKWIDHVVKFNFNIRWNMKKIAIEIPLWYFTHEYGQQHHVSERERHEEKMQYGRRKKLLIINYNVSFHFESLSTQLEKHLTATTAPIDGFSPMRCLLIKISNVNNGNYDMKSTRTKKVKRIYSMNDAQHAVKEWMSIFQMGKESRAD